MRFDVHVFVSRLYREWIRLKGIPVGLRLLGNLATQINRVLHAGAGPDDHFGVSTITVILILKAQPVPRLGQLRCRERSRFKGLFNGRLPIHHQVITIGRICECLRSSFAVKVRPVFPPV
ncbi:hypothetical protein D3C87_1347920 [compost metagenome]